MENINETQINLIAHALGIQYFDAKISNSPDLKQLPDQFFRNYFCVGSETSFNDDMISLKKTGLIKTYSKFENLYFLVTDKGIQEFRKIFKTEVTDKYIPVSKSKNRYLEYLRADTGLTFVEYNGIWTPKKEFDNNGRIRFVSTKHNDVKGEYLPTHKEAKISYKNALSLKNKAIRDNNKHVECRLY